MKYVMWLEAVRVDANSQAEAIARAKTLINTNLNNMEFEDIVNEDEAEEVKKIEVSAEELLELDKKAKEFEDDEDY